MTRNHTRGILVLGIICLFVGVGIYPAFAVNSISSTTTSKDEGIEILDEEEIRFYLFQTIIDIVNNPEIKELLDEYNYQISFSNDNNRDIIRKLLFRNPKLLTSFLFIKPSITNDFLENMYNLNKKIKAILGEEELLEIKNSIKIRNPNNCCELSNIIKNNNELNQRILKLSKINHREDIVIDSLVCVVLGGLSSGFFLIFDFFWVWGFQSIAQGNYILGKLFQNIGYIFAAYWVIFCTLYLDIGCEEILMCNSYLIE